MTRSNLTAITIIAVIGMAIAPTTASAGNGNAVGAGLLGLGVGAIVGSALTPREVYVVPFPAPPPALLRSRGLLWAAALGSKLVSLLPKDVWSVIQPKNGLFPSCGWRLVLLPIATLGLVAQYREIAPRT